MAITRITAVWGNFRGAPGYSNFYLTGGPLPEAEIETAAVALRNFFSALVNLLPEGVTITIRGSAETIDEASGQITGQVDFSPPSQVTGAGTGGYSAASGAVINWNTTDYNNGRRVRGRTFFVPLTATSYDSNGDITNNSLVALREESQNLIEGFGPNPMVVWSRPVGGAGGSAHVVTNSSVPDLGAVLRSRRD